VGTAPPIKLPPHPARPPHPAAAGLSHCGKYGLKQRLLLAQHAVQQLLPRSQLFELAGWVARQAVACMSAHRHDGASMAALADLLAALASRLSQHHQQQQQPDLFSLHLSRQAAPFTSAWLFRELLGPILVSTFK